MKLQEAHLNNISRLAELGKIVIAGPLLNNSEIREFSSLMPKVKKR
jgi:uncharacterized protein YciI